MIIKLSKQDATEILTDLFFRLINDELQLGQGEISVGIDWEDEKP